MCWDPNWNWVVQIERLVVRDITSNVQLSAKVDVHKASDGVFDQNRIHPIRPGEKRVLEELSIMTAFGQFGSPPVRVQKIIPEGVRPST